ncbi:glycosyltransferase family 4 protein [Microbacterium dextranolyticum]|nr:glycosyltransferase family 4 protein [Microbacterium dextranolyticum]MBM7462083.1 glycosyltransferase involved in cell wall biosynthesis [Microbacterium dextranolyticum]
MTSMWANRAIRTALGVVAARAFERRVLRHVDKVVVTSIDEDIRLRSIYGRSADAIVASGVQLGVISRSAHRNGIGWMSSFNYGPNVDGLRAFLQLAWPALADEGHHLWVAGAGEPPADLKAIMERDPAITFSGFVADLDTWMSEREAAVVPIWAGAGVKLKTLTWLASETPVISTDAGIEGIAVRDGESFLIASTPVSFAARIRDFYGMTVNDRENLGRCGRELVEREFGAETLSVDYVKKVASWAGA